MTSFIEKTEYAVYEDSDSYRNADYWFDDRDQAIAKAKAIGGRVDKVTHYATDYSEIYNAAKIEEDDQD